MEYSLVACRHFMAAEGIAHAQLLMTRIETFLHPTLRQSTTDPVSEITGSLLRAAQLSIARALSVLSPSSHYSPVSLVVEQKPNPMITTDHKTQHSIQETKKRKMLDVSGATDNNKRRSARNNQDHDQCCCNNADCTPSSYDVNHVMISTSKLEETMAEAMEERAFSIASAMDPWYADKLMMIRRHLLDDD